MFEATFRQAYPMARRAAQVRATVAAVRGAIPAADREDIEQEALTACWRALPRFDARRGSLATFVECIVATRVCSLVRSANRRPALQTIDLNSDYAIDPEIGRHELRVDIERLLKGFGDHDRGLALLLMEYTPSDAGRMLGVARSTIYERIQKLRVRFTEGGFGPRQSCARARGQKLSGEAPEVQ
jgi:DNA-directed RNA polymerase specialized sigma24 family protein